jgi:phytoene synthase
VSASPPPDIRRQIRQCRRLSRSSAGTFHHAFGLLPRERRDALHVIYRFCRLVDDAVDEPEDDQFKRDRLGELKRNLNGAGEGEPWEALEWVRDQYDIPTLYFRDLIKGAQSDIGTVEVEDYAGLRTYCYRVAGTVGLMTLHVMGFSDQAAIPYSLAMGRAFQITNILRDLEEDRAVGRRYVPAEFLERHGASGDWCREEYSSSVRGALAELGRRARLNYRQCLPLFEMVNQRARLPLALMTSLYSWYLAEIQRRDYDVQSDPVSLSKRELPRLFWNSIRATRGRAEHCLMIS